MEKVIDFENTEFAKDVITDEERIIFKKRDADKKPVKAVKKVVVKKKYEDFHFNLFGDEILVHFVDQLFSDEEPDHWIFGNSNYAEQIINLSIKRPSGQPLSSSQIKQTFIHECVHIMLESGQFYEESYNEALVEWMAKCINVLFFTNPDIKKVF